MKQDSMDCRHRAAGACRILIWMKNLLRLNWNHLFIKRERMRHCGAASPSCFHWRQWLEGVEYFTLVLITWQSVPVYLKSQCRVCARLKRWVCGRRRTYSHAGDESGWVHCQKGRRRRRLGSQQEPSNNTLAGWLATATWKRDAKRS